MMPHEEIRNALDHIVRIAKAAQQSTRRLDCISSRAQEALRRVPWIREYLPQPKRASMDDGSASDGQLQRWLHAQINSYVRRARGAGHSFRFTGAVHYRR